MLRAVQSPTLYAYQKASVLLPSILIMTNMLKPKDESRSHAKVKDVFVFKGVHKSTKVESCLKIEDYLDAVWLVMGTIPH